MNVYDFFMYPLEKMGLRNARKRLIPKANGNVLEVGTGTGVNYKHYNMEEVTNLIMTDLELSKKLKKLNDVTLIEANLLELPFEDNSFDTVVATLVFCSVKDVKQSLNEVNRVLKDGGIFIFIEHVKPKRKVLGSLFDIITPVWKRVASNCHLNRDFIKSLERTNMEIIEKNTFGNDIFVYGTAKKASK